MTILKKNSLIFRLELNGRVVQELKPADPDSEITIGRGEHCTLRIPAEDRGASSVHARIFRKGKHYFIQDLNSRNGVYFMGSKIQERKLSVGELYSIGDCKLLVDRDSGDARPRPAQEQFHKLEQLSGQERGRVYHLTEDQVKIGASSGCSIVLNDSLVSHLHAVLENHADGTCWIRDMGSRNGTKVNGTLLTEENAEVGRMLRDGDIISIAYLDFRFWDRAVVHVRSHLLLKVGVVVATLAIVLGGYFAFQAISPSAKSIRLTAEGYAARGNFAAAREVLQSAASARGADMDSPQRLELMRKLEIWEETFQAWAEIRKLLSGKPGEGNLYAANDLFAVLSSSNRERWQWNVSNASVEMKRAQETQALLAAVLGAEERMRQAEMDISYLQNARSRLTGALAACRKNSQPYQAALQTRGEDLVREMDQQSIEERKVRQIMDGCTSASSIDQTIRELEKLRNDSLLRVEQRKKAGKCSSQSTGILCGKLLVTLRELLASRDIMERNEAFLAGFEFSKFQEDLRLPSVEACILSPNLSARRVEMERDNQQLKQVALQLKNFQIFFTQNSIAPGMSSPLLTAVFDSSLWERVLSCDCLKLAQPSYREKKARSDYDRMLGVYVFWEYLRSLGGEFDSTIFEERFKPELFKSSEIFNHLEVFLQFCEPGEKSRFFHIMKRLIAEKNGKSVLNEYIASAKEILRKRDELVKQMYELFRKDSGSRRGILAGGVALYLLPEGWKKPGREQLTAELNRSLKELRKKLALLNEQNQNSSPERRLANEKKILAIGIPGDAFLKQPWTDLVERKK